MTAPRNFGKTTAALLAAINAVASGKRTLWMGPGDVNAIVIPYEQYAALVAALKDAPCICGLEGNPEDGHMGFCYFPQARKALKAAGEL